MKILVTGAAGFIGSKVMCMLSERGEKVVGIDNLNDYYDVRMKYGRLAECGILHPSAEAEWPYAQEVESSRFSGCRFIRLDITDKEALDRLFDKEEFDSVVNLAAQAGVRYSITNPYEYLKSNMDGFLNILEACRYHHIKHLVFASSSSVYGMNDKVPYAEDDKTETPVSLYAASKKSDELMAHSYAKLYDIPVTGLRYFTVYGPWGRPDMSPMLFAQAITKGEEIKIFNNGDMIRDFTYIDDIAEGTLRVLYDSPVLDESSYDVPYRIYNIGCSHPVKLMDFITEIEDAVGKKAVKRFLPMQPGDVYQTNADTTRLESEIGFKPEIRLHEGISRFIKWFTSEENPLQ